MFVVFSKIPLILIGNVQHRGSCYINDIDTEMFSLVHKHEYAVLTKKKLEY